MSRRTGWRVFFLPFFLFFLLSQEVLGVCATCTAGGGMAGLSSLPGSRRGWVCARRQRVRLVSAHVCLSVCVCVQPPPTISLRQPRLPVYDGGVQARPVPQRHHGRPGPYPVPCPHCLPHRRRRLRHPRWTHPPSSLRRTVHARRRGLVSGTHRHSRAAAARPRWACGPPRVAPALPSAPAAVPHPPACWMPPRPCHAHAIPAVRGPSAGPSHV
jgi:hypothetical protein